MKKQALAWLTLLVTLTLGINFAQAGPGTKAAPVKLPAPYNTGANGDTYTYYANSPAGKWNTAFSNASSNSGKPLRKFVDRLPGLGTGGANLLGAYIPVASKMPNPVAGDPADYYEIEVTDFNQQMHSDLPGPYNTLVPGSLGTRLRGYRDMSNSNPARYLGPLIIAKTYDPTKPANTAGNGAPVRIKFVNSLGTSNGLNGAGDLFIPVDTTAMGAGLGPDSWAVGTTGLVTPSGIKDTYLQNRAELHLHGGVNPWISDGTPHQWITPAVDSATRYPKGVSQINVPDMADPGPGAATYYYSNQQSARLMWYHDHAYGLTRLNAYVGGAAGYLLTDQAEQDMINVSKVLPDLGTPLIIQDKTFVPVDIAVQDAKWTNPLWGKYGDLWFPHVYEPNQNPLSLDGANPYGRWDYGPWFWPPVALVNNYVKLPSAGSNDTPSLTPEGFMDTALVNGTAYPYMDVEPKAYRFRILNGANDRPFNLQLYVSDPASPDNFSSADTKGFPTEVAMLPAARWPNCKTNTAATALAPLNCSCTATFSPKGCWPATWPADGRDGGAPDPQFIGPTMIQIGTEGGLLPAPVMINNNPVAYDYNRRNIVVLDILYKSLLLAPAERADVLIDFSAFAGKTIILYSDAPAPMPAFDMRNDYFTNDTDQTASGGAPTTLPGYGPNTRTMMQFRVGSATTGTALHYKNADNSDAPLMATLKAAITAAFTATQPKPIVPESVYKANYPADPSPNLVPGKDVYSTIFDNSLTFTPLGGTAASTPITVNFQSKAIQELWDPYGRMNATLGIELPMTNNRVQTTIPYGYVDPPTELLDDNGAPLLWKITHNGVDTHPVHFHLYNVQVINRVGWDGAIRPPDANELGWKETVRMKPLEDVVVAFQPVLPKLPFGLPKSRRLLDPAFPAGAISTVNAAGAFSGDGPVFMNIGIDGNPIIVGNVMTDFDHEYVWHCHILGHEENDFMRPQIVKDGSVIPDAFTLSAALAPGQVDLTWSDGTPAGAAATMGNAKNEIGFRIYRCTGVGCSINVATDLLKTALANQTTYADSTAVIGDTYAYQVWAYNAAGTTASNAASLLTQAVAMPPASINVQANSSNGSYSVSWGVSATAGATYVLQESTDPAFATYTETVGATSPVAYSGKAGGMYYYRVKALATGFLDSAWVTGTNGCVVPIPVTNATLTPSPLTSQSVGQSVQFTAKGTGGNGTPEYQYWVNVGGTWTAQPWTTNPIWTWNTTGLSVGYYPVTVYVRNVGSSAQYEAWKMLNFALVNVPVSTATLTSSPLTSQAVGQSVQFTATGTGGSGTPEYQYWVNIGGTWTAQPWTTNPVWTWNTTGLSVGTYPVSVYVRNVGSVAQYEAWKMLNYVLTLVNSPVATAATTITYTGFTANWDAVAGTTNYLLDVSSSKTFASFVTGYSNLNVGNVTFFAVTGLNSGTIYYYRVRANVLSNTSANSSVITVQTVNIVPVSTATLTPSPLTSQTVGQPVQFTATGTGGGGTPEYQFWVNVGGTWTSQPWTTNPIWTWNTTGLSVGYYPVSVYVRNVGSLAQYEAWKMTTYQLQ